MNDQEWAELDAQLKKAFEELKAVCAKARKRSNAGKRALLRENPSGMVPNSTKQESETPSISK